MAKGWRKQVLATGKLRTARGREGQSFDEFLNDQRIRVMNGLRSPVREDPPEGHYYEQGEHPGAAKNDGMTRANIFKDCDQELRGRV